MALIYITLPHNIYYNTQQSYITVFMKTLFDYLIASITLLIMLPFLLIIAIAIKIDSKGPVFYRQTRVGQGFKEFKIFKFRTMRDVPGSNLTLGNKDSRITRVGKIIRKLHLDEFAQLINVLKADMSLVGPRPELPEFTKIYSDQWQIVLKCKPGITGLAALKSADYEYNILSDAKNPKEAYIKTILPKKLRYDCFYVKKKSIRLDILIIVSTVCKMI